MLYMRASNMIQNTVVTAVTQITNFKQQYREQQRLTLGFCSVFLIFSCTFIKQRKMTHSKNKAVVYPDTYCKAPTVK